MPRPRSDNEVEHYEAELAATTKKLEEARARVKARQARDHHRRCQLAGECALQLMEAEPNGPFSDKMTGALERHARSAADRALFGSPKSSNP
jgi:hypothetical protein